MGGQKDPLVWYGSADFKKHTIAEGGWSTVSGAVGDVDGDNVVDVLLGGSVWFENPGNLRAAPGQPWRLNRIVEDPTHDIAVGDFNDDGRLDIAFAEMHQGADPDEVGLLLKRGAGHPGRKVVVRRTGSHGLQILDVDGDGAPDPFGANWSGPLQSVQVWHNLTGSRGRVPASGATPVSSPWTSGCSTAR